MAQQPTPAQLGPSPKISRAVFAMLETHFDEKSGRYNSGWSDERIAKEAATAVDLVVRMRVEAYGELAEDPKITELRDEIELLRMEIEEASKAWSQRLDALQRRADDLGQRRKLAG